MILRRQTDEKYLLRELIVFNSHQVTYYSIYPTPTPSNNNNLLCKQNVTTTPTN